MRLLSRLKYDFFNASAPVYIPSPFDVAVDIKERVVAHVRHVQAEQQAFQDRIQAVGIERLSKMTSNEVLRMYGCG